MLTANELVKINEIFKEKNWNDANLYDRYCTILNEFSIEERKLIIELTQNFLCIFFEEYLNYLKEVLSKFLIEERIKLEEIKRIIVCPLLPLKKIELATKSSNFLCYLFKSHEIQTLALLKNKKIEIIEEFHVWEKKIIENEGKTIQNIYERNLKKIKNFDEKTDLVLLIDDFIGSGQTAKDSLEFFTTELGVGYDNIRILCLAIHQMSSEKIPEDIKIYYKYCIDKGINNKKYSSDEIDKKIELMKSIERKLRAKSNVQFGYSKSEALITLIRTPNNTFPIFFADKSKSVRGIFPR